MTKKQNSQGDGLAFKSRTTARHAEFISASLELDLDQEVLKQVQDA